MKIGIFTFFDGCNFGEQLQAYTSQKYFESLGHDVWIINYSKDKEEYNYSRYPEKQAFAHRLFAETRLKTTERLSQDDILSYIIDNCFDVVAFGADAIWNKRNKVNLGVYSAQWLNNANLRTSGGNSLRVIGLSPAFMGKTYSDLTVEEKESFRKGLLNFTYPNTRDEWTRVIINSEIMGFDFIKTINPDPVFLLNELCVDDWNPLYSDIESKKYYILSLPMAQSGTYNPSMKEWLLNFKRTINLRGYKLVELPLPDGPSGLTEFDYSIPYPIDPLQWFLWIKNAKAYIGLRFHPIVSCISSGTPFFSLDGYGYLPIWINYLNRLGFHKLDRRFNTGSKIRNLLEGSHLEQYRINGALPNSMKPLKIVKLMDSFDLDALTTFREKNIDLFKSNMKKALS